MTRAMLLCAGESSRLRDIGRLLPKPLLPVCDLPIVRYGTSLCAAHGIRDIVINLHHLGELFERELGDGSAFGVRLHYSREATLLGTGGGLKHALSLLDPEGSDEPFVSLNGKLIFDLDLGALLEAHRRDPEALGTMVVRRSPDARAWGAVDVQPDGGGRLRVRDILGSGEYMFCGVHVTRPSVVRRLPDGAACMVRQGYLPWIREGGQVAAFDAGSAYFAEHSTPPRYLAGNLDLLAREPLRHAPGPNRGIAPNAHIDSTARIVHPVYIGPSAHIGPQTVIGPQAIVGAHAVVEAGSELERCVVWAGARAAGRVSQAVVTFDGVIDASGPVAP
jgi:NDP-sugar pyrophosphorylase family protein